MRGGKIGSVSCNALKYLFLHPDDKADACRADVYRFPGIPSCLEIAGWSAFELIDGDRGHRGTRRISDIESAIFPSEFFRTTLGIRPESRRIAIILRKEIDELWLMISRISFLSPVISEFIRCIKRHFTYNYNPRGWIFYRKSIRL